MEFALTLPSLDFLINDTLQCTGTPKLLKIGIACAVRNIWVDLGDALKLWMMFDQKYYIDGFLAFGAVNSTGIFQRVAYAI